MKTTARLGGVLVAAAVAVAGVGVMPAAADGPGSTTIATGPTVGASLMLLSDGNWSVVMGATGFRPGSTVDVGVKVNGHNPFWIRSARATSAPSTYCPGYAPCVVYPAGSIVPPVTVPLEWGLNSVDGVKQISLVNCGDSLAAYGVEEYTDISSPTVALTIPACTTGGTGTGGGTGSGGGKPPKPLPM